MPHRGTQIVQVEGLRQVRARPDPLRFLYDMTVGGHHHDRHRVPVHRPQPGGDPVTVDPRQTDVQDNEPRPTAHCLIQRLLSIRGSRDSPPFCF